MTSPPEHKAIGLEIREPPLYPKQIELFSADTTLNNLFPDQPIIPILQSSYTSPLSAILLDQNYCDLLECNKKIIEALPLANEIALIPLKAKAFLDLTFRRASGETVDSTDIAKHWRDVLRLSLALAEGERYSLPDAINKDLINFLVALNEMQIDQKAIKMIIGRSLPLVELQNIIKRFYGLP